MARTPLVVGNWKLHNTVAESLALAGAVRDQVASLSGVEVGVAPVFTALAAVGERLKGSQVRLTAQDCHFESSGAWTGEVSPPLLRDVGCSYVIVGHSERRQHFGDRDDLVGRKARAVL